MHPLVTPQPQVRTPRCLPKASRTAAGRQLDCDFLISRLLGIGRLGWWGNQCRLERAVGPRGRVDVLSAAQRECRPRARCQGWCASVSGGATGEGRPVSAGRRPSKEASWDAGPGCHAPAPPRAACCGRPGAPARAALVTRPGLPRTSRGICFPRPRPGAGRGGDTPHTRATCSPGRSCSKEAPRCRRHFFNDSV